MSEAPRLFTVGFEGTQAPADLLRLVAAGLGGVILFQRNIQSPRQIADLVRELKGAASDLPLVISMDQEGGRVARLRGAPWAEIPPMRDIGRLPVDEGVASAGRVGELLGSELAAVGIDLDFAPVLDVDTNAMNPVIGDRSFAREAQRVAALGAALIAGLQGSGVAACGKHFPGHGDTAVDSHFELPRIEHDRGRLEHVELVPFAAAARAGVAALMTAHILCDAFDPDLPATLSGKTLKMLRDEIGFRGVIVSDDLEMKAISEHWPIERAAPLAIAAGCDQLLICRGLNAVPAAIAAVERALEDGSLSQERIEAAVDRWDTLAMRCGSPPPEARRVDWLDSKAHRALIAQALKAVGGQRRADEPGQRDD